MRKDSPLIYIDTNVYLDYLLERKNRKGRDISSHASKLFFRAVSCEFRIATSSWLFAELCNNIDVSRVAILSETIKHKVKNVLYTDDDVKRAKSLSDNWEDALHGILANKIGANYLITRNTSDFDPVRHLIEVKRPEDL